MEVQYTAQKKWLMHSKSNLVLPTALHLQVIDLEGFFLDRGKAFLLAWHAISNVNIKSSLPTKL